MLSSFQNLLKLNLLRKYLPSQSKAIKLDAFSDEDIKQTAKIIKDGGIVAFPFNGVFGLFGDINNKKVIEKINKAKGRPKDKKLVIVTLPELIDEFLNFTKMPYSHEQLKTIWSNLHALGILGPPNEKVASHITNLGSDPNLIAIWTEYEPMRKLIKELRAIGGTALFGTSANKTGQPTHTNKTTVWQDFIHDVEAIVEADFDHLPKNRKKSTTIVDFTSETPVLMRKGNAEIEEIQKVFKKLGIKKLLIPKNHQKS